MSDIKRVMAYVHGSAWAIDEEKMTLILGVLDRRAQGIELSAVEVAAVKRDQPKHQNFGAIGVLPMFGTIFPRAGMVSEISGGVSLDSFRANLSAMVSDPAISAIILHVDSPGGAVAGVTEAFGAVMVARQKKRIIAVADGIMASAAYCIASAAHEIVASPSALVGSIGVLAIHTDMSESDSKAGVKTTITKAGKYKGEGIGPLTGEAIAAQQSLVDEVYGVFVGDVARGRGTTTDVVANGYGEGRVLSAKNAAKARMVDRVATLDDTIKRIGAEIAKNAKYKQLFGV